jgi:hypothetical protein
LLKVANERYAMTFYEVKPEIEYSCGFYKPMSSLFAQNPLALASPLELGDFKPILKTYENGTDSRPHFLKDLQELEGLGNKLYNSSNSLSGRTASCAWNARF